MKIKLCSILLIVIIACLMSGCWNYKELEQLAIVSGVTIDKDEKDMIDLTVEIVRVQQEQKMSRLQPVYIEKIAPTFFDAARGIIALEGKKLFWSHAKVIIISEAVAKEGLSKVLDFVRRDAETREDMWVLLARTEKASDIFKANPSLDTILSFQLDNAMRSQKAVSRYPSVELFNFIDTLSQKYTAAVIPTITTIEIKGNTIVRIAGAAIIKGDNLIGFLDEKEAKCLLWIKNKVKGGVFVVKNVDKTNTNVTLEIYKCKTKIITDLKNDLPVIKISLIVDVDIGEIAGKEDFINPVGREKLKKDAEKQIKKDIENLIEKAQNEFKTDIFGFGEKIKHFRPKEWKGMEKIWDETFTELKTTVEVDVRIKGSATTRKPLKIGE